MRTGQGGRDEEDGTRRMGRGGRDEADGSGGWDEANGKNGRDKVDGTRRMGREGWDESDGECRRDEGIDRAGWQAIIRSGCVSMGRDGNRFRALRCLTAASAGDSAGFSLRAP